jgi:DNA-binding MarR family transcriptional regulator
MPGEPSSEIPADDDAFRSWRDASLYRLMLRAGRAEQSATLLAMHDRGYDDLSLSDIAVLANLDTAGTTISGLARRVGVTRQAASQQLAELDRAGYVTRAPDPGDRRAVMVGRTPKGEALLADAVSFVAGLERHYADLIGADQLATLKELLAALVARIDPEGALGRD